MISIPVEVGEKYQIEITNLSHNAEGIGRYEGFTIFVPVSIPGDIVNVEIISTKKTYARGLITELVTPSADRVTPSCPIYDECGGCQLQHQIYEAQLRVKQNLVQEAMAHIGGLSEVNVAPVLGMENPWHYRNKASLPVSGKKGDVTIGFYKPRSHDIVNVETCPIQHPLINKALKALRKYINAFWVKPYNEIDHTGVLRHVIIRVAPGTEQLLIVLVINEEDLPALRNVTKALEAALPELTGVVLNINNRKTNVIMGKKETSFLGGKEIVDDLLDRKFIISAQSFYQVNSRQTPVLYQQAIDMADLQGDEVVIDAYCGTGTIGLMLADKADQVIGVDVVPAAIADAKRNAKLNRIMNAQFIVGKAEEVIPRLIREGINPNVVVVDPPRKGCDPALLQAIVKAEVTKVVYVSCNPATLARDLAILVENRYAVSGNVQPVDMFPHTGHVESVVCLVKQ